MKKLAVLILLSFTILGSYAITTESSEFLEKQQKQICNSDVKINVKKEHTEEYMQKIGDVMIPAITYGYGDMKIKKKKKCRISYVTLLDEKCDIIWGYVIPR